MKSGRHGTALLGPTTGLYQQDMLRALIDLGAGCCLGPRRPRHGRIVAR